MTSATAASPHLFWITSRAAGTIALLLSSVGVGVGLLMGGKLLRGRGADLRTLHEVLSLSTMAAIVIHAGTLVGDSFLHPSVVDVAVPFASSYKTVWTTIGIVGAWATLILGLSFYLRARIGQQRWRILHRFTALAWILGIVHTLGEGTDAGQTWFLVMVGIVTVPALLLLAFRWLLEPAPPAAPAEAAR